MVSIVHTTLGKARNVSNSSSSGLQLFLPLWFWVWLRRSLVASCCSWFIAWALGRRENGTTNFRLGSKVTYVSCLPLSLGRLPFWAQWTARPSSIFMDDGQTTKSVTCVTQDGTSEFARFLIEYCHCVCVSVNDNPILIRSPSFQVVDYEGSNHIRNPEMQRVLLTHEIICR